MKGKGILKKLLIRFIQESDITEEEENKIFEVINIINNN